MNAEHTFAYPSELASEEKMFDNLHAVLKQLALSRERHQQILLAVSEAFSNALTHGNQLNPEKTIKLSVRTNESSLIVDIVDEGSKGMERIAVRQAPTSMSEGGRGVDLMNHCATAVQFGYSDQGGLRVTLTFAIE
jgi:anti-sigma regulatory factor (Ser/Thr protein kinase)